MIPAEYQSMVEQYATWNDEIGEWQLRCVAYTGNNMRRSSGGASATERTTQVRRALGTTVGTAGGRIGVGVGRSDRTGRAEGIGMVAIPHIA